MTHMLKKIDYNEQKLKELVLYVAGKCYEDPSFGAVKLNKILYFSDFEAYAAWGRPITGAVYRKREHGPCPARIQSVKKELERSDDAYEYLNPLPAGKQQKRLLARRLPKYSCFLPEEISLVDTVIFKLWGKTAVEVSDMTHKHAGWKYAKMNGEIPYHTAFLPRVGEMHPLTEAEQAWVRTVVEQFGTSTVPA